MGTIGPTIPELAQQGASVWQKAIALARHLASDPLIERRHKSAILHLDGRVLHASPLDPEWREYAEDLVAEWRASGLDVTLITHLAKPTEPGTYVLTARTKTLALICTCQSWSDLATKEPVWSIAVSVRSLERDVASATGTGPLRHLGVATAPTHEAVWQVVFDWLDSQQSFDPNVLNTLGPAMPTAEQTSRKRTEARLPDSRLRPLFLYGGASAMVAMVALLFVILGGEREPEQTAEPSRALTGAEPSAIMPDDQSGDMLDVRATPAPSLPTALASDDLKRPEQDPPLIVVSEADKPDPDVPLRHAGDPFVGLPSANLSMLSATETDPLPPPLQSLEEPLQPVTEAPEGSVVTSRSPDVNVGRPALTDGTRVNMAVRPVAAGERAHRSSARRSPPLPRAKPSSPVASGLALVSASPPAEITSQGVGSAGGRTVDRIENATIKPQNRPEPQRMGPIPLTPIARPEYAVQVAAVTHPAAAPRVWSQTTARFPGLGDLRLLDPAPVEVGDKGRRLLYRVAAGTFEQREAAEATCNKVRARAGECIVISY